MGWAGSVAVAPGMQTIFLDDQEGRWTASATAYRCVQAIAANAASLQLQVRAADDTNVEGHWLTALWERPNPLLSRRVLAEVMWSRLETRGEQFTYIDRGQGGGRPVALWPLFCQVQPVIVGVRDPDAADRVRENLLGYYAYVNGQRVPLAPSDVLWLRYPHPGNPWSAMAPLEAAGHAVELDAYARAWQMGEFRNGAKPSNVVYLGDLDQAAYTQAVETWKSEVQGSSNAGKSLLVASGSRSAVDRLTLSPEEMSWIDSRGVNSQEVMLGFGVPKDYLLGGATYENRAASRTTLWSDTIVPKLEIVASEMTRQLLDTEAPRRVRFDTDDVDALQEGADAKATRTTSLTSYDVLTLDEARAEVGLDALPNGIGGMTLTAYRVWVQTQAQAALIASNPEDRQRHLQLPSITTGAAALAGAAAPMLLPSGVRKHGPSASTILSEYDRHERLVAKATARLAKRQQAVVLTNAERLLKGSSKKAAQWLADLAHTSLGYASDDDTRRAEAEAELRAKVDDLFDPKHWEAETRDAMEGPVSGAWHSGATTLAKSLGIDFDKFDLLVLTAMDARLDVLSEKVTATTRQVLEDRVLLQGVANGESIDQLKARIRGVFSDMSSWRATAIARTETVGGFNKASLVIAEASGQVREREWLATDDGRTRETHAAQDGQRIKGFTSRYTNGCLHPGDPTARPEETIQCRCVELYLTED